MTNVFILAQIVGIVVAVWSIIIAQFKKLSHILIGEIISNLLVVLNYALLGGISGAGICLLAVVQTIWVYILQNKKLNVSMLSTAVFMLGYTVISAFSYDGFPSVISCIAALSYAVAIVQKKPSGYRICMVFNSLLWIMYDVCTQAYTTIFTHGFLLISIIIAIVRLDLKKE